MVVSEEFIKVQKIRIWTQRLIEEYRQIQFTYNLKLRIPVIRVEKLSSKWGTWDLRSATVVEICTALRGNATQRTYQHA